jgi:hypothetical protein
LSVATVRLVWSLWLLITTAIGKADKAAIAELRGNSDHPLGKLGQIAEALLEPLADDASL